MWWPLRTSLHSLDSNHNKRVQASKTNRSEVLVDTRLDGRSVYDYECHPHYQQEIRILSSEHRYASPPSKFSVIFPAHPSMKVISPDSTLITSKSYPQYWTCFLCTVFDWNGIGDLRIRVIQRSWRTSMLQLFDTNWRIVHNAWRMTFQNATPEAGVHKVRMTNYQVLANIRSTSLHKTYTSFWRGLKYWLVATWINRVSLMNSSSAFMIPFLY